MSLGNSSEAGPQQEKGIGRKKGGGGEKEKEESSYWTTLEGQMAQHSIIQEKGGQVEGEGGGEGGRSSTSRNQMDD